jgi:hypothetical protein
MQALKLRDVVHRTLHIGRMCISKCSIEEPGGRAQG